MERSNMKMFVNEDGDIWRDGRKGKGDKIEVEGGKRENKGKDGKLTYKKGHRYTSTATESIKSSLGKKKYPDNSEISMRKQGEREGEVEKKAKKGNVEFVERKNIIM
uniref:Uncharacterized protein n=1 Tax=Photinus pyralis TaxID=7054 RepID=A0A1Y1KAW7_PHOPY